MTTHTALATKTTSAASAAPKRSRKLAVRLGLVLAAGAVVLASAACNVDEHLVMDKTNQTRAENGRGALQMNVALWMKAGGWSIKMANDGRLSHSTLADGNPYKWSMLGENVGTGGSIDAIYGALVRSPGHFSNIVNSNFTHTGVGIYFDGRNYWVTQEFMALQ